MSTTTTTTTAQNMENKNVTEDKTKNQTLTQAEVEIVEQGEAFLKKYGSRIEDIIFTIRLAKTHIVPYLYTVLKSKYIEATNEEKVMTYVHTTKIVKDAIKAMKFRKVHAEEASLGFLDVFFENPFAIQICSGVKSYMTELFTAMKDVLISPDMELQKAVIRVLIRFLASYKNEWAFTYEISEEMIRLLLDKQIYLRLRTSDAEYLNLSFNFFFWLSTRNDFKYMKKAKVVQRCLEVVATRLEELEGLSASWVYGYFRTCLNDELELQNQELIMTLYNKLFEKKNWTVAEKSSVAELLIFCKDPLGNGPLLEQLQTLNLAQGVMDWLEKFLMRREPEFAPISEKFHDNLRNLQLSLINFLCFEHDDTKADLIWTVMTQILKYYERRYKLNPAEAKDSLSDIVLSAPLQVFIETFLFVLQIKGFSLARFEYFQCWIFAVGVAHNIPWSSTRIDRPTRLEVMLIKMKSSILEIIAKMKTSSENRKKLQELVAELDSVLQGMGNQRRTPEESARREIKIQDLRRQFGTNSGSADPLPDELLEIPDEVETRTEQMPSRRSTDPEAKKKCLEKAAERLAKTLAEKAKAKGQGQPEARPEGQGASQKTPEEDHRSEVKSPEPQPGPSQPRPKKMSESDSMAKKSEPQPGTSKPKKKTDSIAKVKSEPLPGPSKPTRKAESNSKINKSEPNAPKPKVKKVICFTPEGETPAEVARKMVDARRSGRRYRQT